MTEAPARRDFLRRASLAPLGVAALGEAACGLARSLRALLGREGGPGRPDGQGRQQVPRGRPRRRLQRPPAAASEPDALRDFLSMYAGAAGRLRVG
jgi:hypothetical protein